MKRKVEKQESSTPAPLSAISAVAARRARQQQQPQAGNAHGVATESTELEPPNKRARSSPETSTDVTLSKHGRAVATAVVFDSNIANTEDNLIDDQALIAEITGEGDEEDLSNNADLPRKSAVASENFILSRNRLRKSDIVYSDEHTLCVRLKEKMTLVLIGIYDIWVKRGVVSLMGAKLHPSTKTYRVYAPSTHSLPVIKCVSGVEGSAEIELQSCSCGLQRLKELSPNFSRIWNSTKTPGDSITVDGSFKRSFSVIYTSSDDPLNRPLRPLHLEKKWSTAIKLLSGRAHSLRVLLCGPKGAGKSTFGRYLLNHLLTPAPDASSDQMNDGVAYLDLDPGQPEFATMGNIYLAHLREPCFGPPFSHPNLGQNSRLGKIVRCHHIGATSPKEDPDNYAVCIMNLLDGYRSLTATYPRCPLIINFPGWIFGLGLEVATWIIRSTGLSDVVYMSEKGPEEVIQPLAAAATEAGVILTTLPSQPVEMVTRSSAQLRSMQMQSYFHTIQSEEESHPFWTDVPITRHKPIRVSYSGSRPGIAGIMVLGNRYGPSVLRDIVDGSVVAVVAVEQASAIPNYAGNEANQSGDSQSVEGEINTTDSSYANDNNDEDDDGGDDGISELQDRQLIQSLLNDSIVRCPASDLPYLAWGAGSSIPLDPKASRCLGLAFVRSIDVTSQHLELISPLPSSVIRDAVRQGHSLVLVRGMTDSPDWAFSEEYYAARNAEQDFVTRMSQIKTGSRKRTEKDAEETTQQRRDGHLQKLQERVRSASRLPYLKVIEDASSLHQTDNRQETGTWRLRKKVYISSDSELD